MRKRKKAESYFELLRDPRWQKARLDTMQRAGFACERCGDKETTLNVHHKNYKRDHAPWEYELSNLVCLCRSCHEEIHEQKALINDLLPYIGLSVSEFMAGVISTQPNVRYVRLLHRLDERHINLFNEDCNSASHYFGTLFFALESIFESGVAFDILNDLLQNDAFVEDFIKLFVTYREALDAELEIEENDEH